MAVTLAEAMYTGTTQPGSSGGYSSQSYRPSFSNNTHRSYSYGWPPIDPPRPLEPRPSLHTSLSESNGSSSHHNLSHGPLSPDRRPHGQNLPGLRDILSPNPRPTSRPSYSGAWTHETGTSSNHSRADSHYARSALHPPMALHPPTDFGAKYQPPRTSPFEVPILQTSPVATQPLQTSGMPSYASHAESRREYGEYPSDNQPVDPRNAFSSGTAVRQYNTVTPDDVQYRTPFGAQDQTHGPPYTPTAPDNRGTYMGVRDFPGEGTFYLYEGGHRIPTHVDGEQVNPAWGLTKANKPRKRLALACLDCREKKIKCEPGVSSCLQCEKAKRTCRRAPAQVSQPDTSLASWQSAADSPNRSRPSNSDPTPATTIRDNEPDHLNKRRTREDSSPPNIPTKRHRSASPARVFTDNLIPPREVPDIPRTSPKVTASSPPRREQSGMLYEWEVDPCSVEPELVAHLLDLYFAHINNATYCIFPRDHFMSWLQNHRVKCQNEKMVLYAMLAMGTIFADASLSGLGKQFASIAGNAVSSQFGKLNMTMTQTHIILCLYHFAKGNDGPAIGHYGSAIQCTKLQRLNEESTCQDNAASLKQSRTEFAMTTAQLTECKRRTFWSAFFMNRCCGASTCDLKPEDVFLRLPCTNDMYERSIQSDAPYFSNGIVDPVKSIITPTSPLSPMAWLMMVADVWGNVVDFTFRAHYRGQDGYREAYEKFHDDTTQALRGWLSRLPPHLQYSEENLDRSIQQGYAGTFIGMHTLYHFAQIKMNRYVRHKAVSDIIPRNLRIAHDSAHEILQLMRAVSNARKSIPTAADGHPSTFSFSTPFPGYATLAAIDIVSAGGWEWMLNPTMQEIFDGLGCLKELAVYWSSAKEQLRACEYRYFQIQNLLQRRLSREGAWLGKKWGLDKPMEQEFDDPDYDCFFGLGDSDAAQEVYFDTLKKDETNARTQPGGLRIV